MSRYSTINADCICHNEINELSFLIANVMCFSSFSLRACEPRDLSVPRVLQHLVYWWLNLVLSLTVIEVCRTKSSRTTFMMRVPMHRKFPSFFRIIPIFSGPVQFNSKKGSERFGKDTENARMPWRPSLVSRNQPSDHVSKNVNFSWTNTAF